MRKLRPHLPSPLASAPTLSLTLKNARLEKLSDTVRLACKAVSSVGSYGLSPPSPEVDDENAARPSDSVTITSLSRTTA